MASQTSLKRKNHPKDTRRSNPSRPSATIFGKTSVTEQIYTPTEKERLALDAHLERRQAALPLPRQIVETVKNGPANLRDGHRDPVVGASLAMEALGLTRVGEL